MKPGILTLTTDFGIGGPYVAAMKGVLLGLAPGTQIVDVCHTIAPQNILEGAFVLAGIVDAFPREPSIWPWLTPEWGSIAGWSPRAWPHSGSSCPITG